MAFKRELATEYSMLLRDKLNTEDLSRTDREFLENQFERLTHNLMHIKKPTDGM